MDLPVLMANFFYLHWVYNEIKSLALVRRNLSERENGGIVGVVGGVEEDTFQSDFLMALS